MRRQLILIRAPILKKFEPDRAEGGRGQIGVAQHLGPQHRKHEMIESREPEPELVGGRPARAGAIGKEILLGLPIFKSTPRKNTALCRC